LSDTYFVLDSTVADDVLVSGIMRTAMGVSPDSNPNCVLLTNIDVLSAELSTAELPTNSELSQGDLYDSSEFVQIPTRKIVYKAPTPRRIWPLERLSNALKNSLIVYGPHCGRRPLVPEEVGAACRRVVSHEEAMRMAEQTAAVTAESNPVWPEFLQ